MNEENKFVKFLMQAAADAIDSGASLKQSPLVALGNLIDAHEDEITRYLEDAAVKLKNGNNPFTSQPGKPDTHAEKHTSGKGKLPDDEREFVERARAAHLDPSRPDVTDFLSGMLTLMDHYHPRDTITLEGLLERYKGGSIPTADLEKVLAQSKK